MDKSFFITNEIDIWVWRKQEDAFQFLMLRNSQEKVNKWFSGVQFWNIPGDEIKVGQKTSEECYRILKQWTGLNASD